MEAIILASASPRRQDILRMLNIPFQVIIPEVDESDIPVEIHPSKIAEYLARKKVNAIVEKLSPDREIPWILGADTVIELDGQIYGKPKNNDEAADFLRAFQSKTHTVMTSIALYNGKTRLTSSVTSETQVTFSRMTEKEINWYVDTGEWHGAAGGYRIQSLAQCFIKKIEGSQSCVAGLPISELFDILKRQGYSIIE